MSIRYAILGLIKEKPMSGYDIKKSMQDSLYMHWSGNNNQIYKALVSLREELYLTCEVVHRDDAPSKKVYQITDVGRSALREWAGSTPPPLPEFRKPILLQLSSADLLDDEEVQTLLGDYQAELEAQLLLQREQERREAVDGKDGQLRLMQKMIYENIFSFFQTELDWTKRLSEELRILNDQ